MAKLVFLGTAGQLPTKERNVQSIYLEYDGKGMLLDCGEGTQRQLSLAGLSPQKISTILISHWHGDHTIGLLGLIQTIDSFAPADKQITIYGPQGSKTFFQHMLQSTAFTPTIDIVVEEVQGATLETFHEEQDYYWQARQLDHDIPCLGYRFVRRERRRITPEKLPVDLPRRLIGTLQQGEAVEHEGSTIQPDDVSSTLPEQALAFIFDTKLVPACHELAAGAHILITEATFLDDLCEKATQYHHLTARQAAEIARDAGVEELILTHFSQRYKTTEEHLQEAQELFPATRCAEDFLEITLPF